MWGTTERGEVWSDSGRAAQSYTTALAARPHTSASLSQTSSEFQLVRTWSINAVLDAWAERGLVDQLRTSWDPLVAWLRDIQAAPQGPASPIHLKGALTATAGTFL